MKKLALLTVLISSLSFVNRSYALFGGPDAYGYTWKDSNEPGGPVYNWIDISTNGTLVTGLADDNSAPSLINMGFNFHFYWGDYNKVKIGSNGWISFDNPSNIASCFPSMQTPGGAADNIIAGFMTDLTFLGAGNIGTVHYWSNLQDTFIVQYTNAPYWQATAPGYNGANSFQIILNGNDSSITFQYMTVSPVNDIIGCNDLVIGIENLTGSIGLNCYIDVMPPTNYSIKFEYPDVPLIAVQDATPFWLENTSSRGEFYGVGSIPLKSNIKNVGNANIASPIAVNAQVMDLAMVLIHQDNDTVNSLNAGFASLVNFVPATINTAGQYSFQVTTNNASDANPTNNIRVSEIEVINACGSTQMSYHTPNLPDQQVSWNAGTGGDDGIGVFYKPPVYPTLINSLDFYIQNALGDGFIATIYANNAPFGAPGTVLYTDTVLGPSVVSASWNNVPLTSPVSIDSAGFYVVFYQLGPNIFIGLETASPISRNTYEILDGAWAAYRENEDQDASFRVNITPPGLDNTVTNNFGVLNANQPGATYQWLDCGSSFAVIPGETAQDYMPIVNGSYACQITFAGCLDTSACVAVTNAGIDENILHAAKLYPNPARSFVMIDMNEEIVWKDASVQITDIMGKLITIPFQQLNATIRLNVEGLSDGMYTYQLNNENKPIARGKFIKQ